MTMPDRAGPQADRPARPAGEPEPRRPAAPVPDALLAGGNAAVARLLGGDPLVARRAPDTGTGGPGDIPLGRRRLSLDPDTARRQLVEIAMSEGVAAARFTLFALRQRITDLGLDRGPGLTGTAPAMSADAAAHQAVLAAVEAELARWDRIERDFERAALAKAGEMLDLSEKRVSAERDRYGITKGNEYVNTELGSMPVDTYGMAGNLATAAMASAARQLLDALGPLQAAVARLEEIQVADTPGSWEFDIGLRPEAPDPAVLAAAQEAVRGAQERYLLLRNAKETAFPVLASFAAYEHLHTYDLKGVRAQLEQVGQGAKAASLVGGDVFHKLENIATVRAALAGGDLSIWGADNLVGLTRISLGIGPKSLEARLIEQRVADDASSRLLRDIFVGLFAMALGLVAAPLTGGGSLGVAAGVTAGAGSAALTTGLAITHIQEFQLDKAANATDFDKARALSSQEPSLFWLALDIFLAGVDAAAALTIFQRLAPFAKQAVGAADEAAEAAIETLGRTADQVSPELGQAVRAAARRQRREPLPTNAKIGRGFVGENDPNNPRRAFFPDTVKYLTAEEREAQRVFVDATGNLRWAKDNSLLDTSGSATLFSGRRAIFVMDGHGNLYVSLEQQMGYLHHSSLLAGADVVGAGEVEVRAGKLVAMTDKSGHYLPTPEQNDIVLQELMEQGLQPHPEFKKYGFAGRER